VRLFRRESLHEKLAREGGLGQPAPPPHDTTPRWGETGIHGIQRPPRWDAVVTAAVPGLGADALRFVSLPDGSLLLEEGPDEADLEPFAEAVEAEVETPYRAEAVRHDDDQWAVAARRIAVVELPDEVDGDELTLTVRDGERTLEVDGERSFGSLPPLEAVGAQRGESYVVHASRLDGPLWEVRAEAL
jgi:hypothetical protein